MLGNRLADQYFLACGKNTVTGCGRHQPSLWLGDEAHRLARELNCESRDCLRSVRSGWRWRAACGPSLLDLAPGKEWRRELYSRWVAWNPAVRARTPQIDSRRSVRWTFIPAGRDKMCERSRERVT